MSVIEMMEAAKRDSVMHRLHPGTKALLCICMIAIPIITINPYVSLVMLFILWGLALPANLKDTFYRIMFILYPVMLVLILIIWPFFFPHGDHVLVNWSFIHITWEGIFYAVAQCLRIAVAITGCIYFVMTTEIIDISTSLGRFLQKFGIGFTVPFMLTTSFKFLPEFLSSYNNIKESFLTRAFELDKGNILQKIKNFIPLFIPLIDTSLDKVTNLASAMQLRAFGVTKKRTYYAVYRFGIIDVLMIILCIVCVVFSIWAQKIKLFGFDLHL